MPEIAARRVPAVPATAWSKVLPPALRFAFFGNSAARAAAQTVWGTEFAEEPCRAIAREHRATLWLGPDEYLLLDMGVGQSAGGPPTGAAQATFAALEDALSGTPHSLVDISHRQRAFLVFGPHAADILNGACPLDLDLHEFPVGMCTRTIFAKADLVLWRTAEDAFHLEVWRSFGGYVSGLLDEIAVNYYPPA